MSKLFSFIVAALFVTITSSSTNAVNTQNTDEKKVDQSQSTTVVYPTVTKKSVNTVYYGWDMTSDPSDPVYRRIDEPLDIDNKCINGTNTCVLESATDHGETITDAQADSFGLTPAPGSSSAGQYLF